MNPRTLLSRAAFLASFATATVAAAAAPREVTVVGSRIHVGDVAPNVDAAASAVDIGPSPAPGASRLITRADITSALDAKQLGVSPAALPEAIRVVRKAKHLLASDLNALVRNAVEGRPMARGVALAAVRAERAVDVAEGWTRVDVDLPRAPKREGSFMTTAIASFFTAEGEAVARISVPVELSISPDGALYDAPRGAAVTLIVRRNYVEVRAPAITTADADLGDPVPVQLRQSGRVLRARLVARDEAVAIEDGQ
jgi:hypothetical protein